MTHTGRVHPLAEQKRKGSEHSRAEIQRLVREYCCGDIDDDGFAHWLRAVMAAGMTLDETAWLTDAMANSGETIRWDEVVGTIVDKHSTGGVGDAVSLIAVPLAASCGIRVAKLSGRALGHTGGTIDKLETIPGLQTSIPVPQFKAQVGEIGCAIAAASEALAPADKKMYGLRHRTSTIASIPLIAASILSKKIAGGAPFLVVDVKAGRCAFMQTDEEARALAEVILRVASRLGRTITVLVTDMDTPLASSIGDALELDEALQVLQGHTEGRLWEVAIAVAEAMLAIRHAGETDREARYFDVLRRAVHDGTAYLRFAEMIRAQGGNLANFERPDKAAIEVAAQTGGVVTSIDGRKIGEAVGASQRALPGGHTGVRMYKREGDKVEKGELLFGAYGADAESLATAVTMAIQVGRNTPRKRPAIIARLHAGAAT